MKKLLSLLTALSLTATSTIMLVGCGEKQTPSIPEEQYLKLDKYAITIKDDDKGVGEVVSAEENYEGLEIVEIDDAIKGINIEIRDGQFLYIWYGSVNGKYRETTGNIYLRNAQNSQVALQVTLIDKNKPINDDGTISSLRLYEMLWDIRKTLNWYPYWLTSTSKEWIPTNEEEFENKVIKEGRERSFFEVGNDDSDKEKFKSEYKKYITITNLDYSDKELPQEWYDKINKKTYTRSAFSYDLKFTPLALATLKKDEWYADELAKFDRIDDTSSVTLYIAERID